MTQKPITVTGAGLAGCEAAWQIAKAGLPVVLQEMRPAKQTPAHKTGGRPNWFVQILCVPTTRCIMPSAFCTKKCAAAVL